MKELQYNSIVEAIKTNLECHGNARNALATILKKFHSKNEDGLDSDTILSLFLNYYQLTVKISYERKSTEENCKKYFKELFCDFKEDKFGIIKLAEKYDIPPGLLARFILQEYIQSDLNLNASANNSTGEKNDGIDTEELRSTRLQLSNFIKRPELINDAHLQEQIMCAFYHDVCYGPINDAIRSSVGLEYENKLLAFVTKLKIPFLLENDLKKRGYDKTPDVKLEIPIVVNSHLVCWIESKASFGDRKSHNSYFCEQYKSYWNRFGPGLVIYWFDFVEELSNEMKDLDVILMNRFPNEDEITFYDSKSIIKRTSLQRNAFAT